MSTQKTTDPLHIDPAPNQTSTPPLISSEYVRGVEAALELLKAKTITEAEEASGQAWAREFPQMAAEEIRHALIPC